MKKIFKVLEETGDLNADAILDKFARMYDCCFSCTELWEGSCGVGGVFGLTTLKLYDPKQRHLEILQ